MPKSNCGVLDILECVLASGFGVDEDDCECYVIVSRPFGK